MAFKGFNEDGEALYDTKESAIERAKMLRACHDPETKIFVHRKHVPLWFAHLVQGTIFEKLAYYEETENQ